jgi:hypothetical protein
MYAIVNQQKVRSKSMNTFDNSKSGRFRDMPKVSIDGHSLESESQHRSGNCPNSRLIEPGIDRRSRLCVFRRSSVALNSDEKTSWPASIDTESIQQRTHQFAEAPKNISVSE